MGKQENDVTQKILAAIAGKAKVGRVQCGIWETKHGAFVHGAPDGTADLCGWKSIVVTPDMIGKKMAVFVGIEIKTKTGRVGAAQKAFRRAVIRDGGICGVCRTEDDAEKLLG